MLKYWEVLEMRKTVFIMLLCAFTLFIVSGCNFSSTQNAEGKDIEQKQIYTLAVESGYKGTYEQWLDSIKGDSIVLQVSNGYIQWKYEGSTG